MATTDTVPSLDTMLIRYDETGMPVGLCRLVDILADIDHDCWPVSADDFEMLLFCLNADALD